VRKLLEQSVPNVKKKKKLIIATAAFFMDNSSVAGWRGNTEEFRCDNLKVTVAMKVAGPSLKWCGIIFLLGYKRLVYVYI